MELVSVIIPTYNRGYCIENSVKSVLRQSYENLEVIIVDDGSNDDTETIIHSISDERVHFYSNKENRGPAFSRNRGIELAKGEYIAFHDSDDVWKEEKLEIQIRALKEGYDLIFSRFQYMNKGTGKIYPPKSIIRSEFEEKPLCFLLRSNMAGTPTIVVRRELLLWAGSFNENLYSCEDWEFIIRMAMYGRIGFVDETLVEVYSQPVGVNDIETNALRQIEAMLAIMEETKEIADEKEFLHDNLFANIFVYRWDYLRKSEQEGVIERVGQIYGMSREFVRHYGNVLRGRRKAQYLSSMMSRMCMREEAAEAIIQNLRHRRAEHIAIYGCGILGQMLFEFLDDIGIKVDFIIDRNRRNCKGRKAYTKEEIPCCTDAIILTYYHEGNDYMYKKMEQEFGTQIISLQRLLESPVISRPEETAI